jgi:kumamolisin
VYQGQFVPSDRENTRLYVYRIFLCKSLSILISSRPIFAVKAGLIMQQRSSDEEFGQHYRKVIDSHPEVKLSQGVLIMNPSHIELYGSRRPLKRGAQRVRDVDPHSLIEVTVTLRRKDEENEELGVNPISLGQNTEQFGADITDVQKVESVLRPYGLSLQHVSADRHSLRFIGTAAAMESAFRPGLGIYHSLRQGEYRGRESILQIPAELDGLVTGVFGLDQRQVARRADIDKSKVQSAIPLTPSDLEVRYKFPDAGNTRQRIAIAEFGIGLTNGSNLPPAYIPDDVAALTQKYGRDIPKIEIVPVNLVPLTETQLAHLPLDMRAACAEITAEVMMDVEIVAALCSNDTIAVYFASFDEKGWIDLLDKVVEEPTELPVSLSISWGLAEDSPDWSSAALTEIDSRLKTAARLGITVCVSSGDDGSGDGIDDNRGHVDFPASSPNVLAVGGTMLSGAEEVTWWESPGRRVPRKGGGATGGGVSVIFPRPSWQNVSVASINPASIDGRVVPDVAALAGAPLYDLVLFGNDAPNGGTSASAPVWAALIARVNSNLPPEKQGRFLTPILYSQGKGATTFGSDVCINITRGQNTSRPFPGRGYEASLGFNAVTGWGVPDGQKLVSALDKFASLT